MPIDKAPDFSNSYARQAGMTGDLSTDYDRLREQLEQRMIEPVKDFARIDELIDRLELIQLAIKGEHGVKGNNPNE
ncbi:MAG: hypothetical protein ABIR35_01675 [Polaromonas sp.]